jgi:hypothetical protein
MSPVRNQFYPPPRPAYPPPQQLTDTYTLYTQQRTNFVRVFEVKQIR